MMTSTLSRSRHVMVNGTSHRGFTLIEAFDRAEGKPPAARKGFTLIELLVVVAIISLLVSILIPSLKAAKELAERAVCLSNLRTLGTGIAVYSGEEDEWVPDGSGFSPSDVSYPESPTWARVIAKTIGVEYITEQLGVLDYAPEQWRGAAISLQSRKDNGVFQCPTEHKLYVNKWAGSNATSYLHNSGLHNLIGFNNGLGFGVGDAYLFHPTETLRNRGRPIKMREVFCPANTFILGETDRIGGLATGFGWGWFEDSNYQYWSGFPPGTYHAGGGDYLWSDGHASTLKPDDLLGEHFDRDK